MYSLIRHDNLVSIFSQDLGARATMQYFQYYTTATPANLPMTKRSEVWTCNRAVPRRDARAEQVRLKRRSDLLRWQNRQSDRARRPNRVSGLPPQGIEVSPITNYGKDSRVYWPSESQ